MVRPAQAIALLRSRGKKVLTFLGYSTTGYERPAEMLEAAQAILADRDPGDTLVNAGATAPGIGAIYPLAHRLGFETAGIVSSQLREVDMLPSPGVEHVLVIEDARWGGIDPATGALSPTSEAMVGASDDIVCIGGGPVAGDELMAAQSRGIPVQFIPADCHHATAIEAARRAGQPTPTDFSGAAHARFHA